MEIDTSNLTDEQISKLGEYVHKMEEENKKATKWWIMSKYSPFLGMADFAKYGPCYYVAPERDYYNKSNPPLKTGFNSKKKAQEWLDNYLKEEDLFSKAKDEIDYLERNLNRIIDKFNNHEYVTSTDWHNCFESFNTSKNHGTIREVTKE